MYLETVDTVLRLVAAVVLLATGVVIFNSASATWKRLSKKNAIQQERADMKNSAINIEKNERRATVHLFYYSAWKRQHANRLLDRILPGCLNPGTVQQGLQCRFDSDESSTFWFTYVDTRLPSGRVVVGRNVGRPENIERVKYLGFVNASPCSVIQEARNLAWDLGLEEAPYGFVVDSDHSWATMLFHHLSTKFDVFKYGDEELERKADDVESSSTSMAVRVIREAPREFEIVIREKDNKEVKRFSMNSDSSFSRLLDEACAHLESSLDWFNERRAVRLSQVYTKENEMHTWGVVLSFEDYRARNFGCLYMKMLSNGWDARQATGFSVGYWENEWPFEEGSQNGYVLSTGRALVKGFAMRILESKQPDAAKRYAFEFIPEFFESLSPVSPSIQTMGNADDQVLKVTVHFYTEYLCVSGHGVLASLRRVAGVFGHQVRHWGLIFEWEDDVFWSMYGDKGRLPHEDLITIRLRIGKPDDVLHVLHQKQLDSTTLSRQQLLEYAKEFERSMFPTPYDVVTVNCHEWAKKFYNHVARKHGMSLMRRPLSSIEWLCLFIINLVLADMIFLEMCSVFSFVVLAAVIFYMRERQLLL